jgi:hypothetical protein
MACPIAAELCYGAQPIAKSRAGAIDMQEKFSENGTISFIK